ncbi:GNAT family N-acetyltransferase [Iamia sp. SCSIO 61187]|uniref:GNAT family N-acetyltransferase n=1 Tax=Iamia sp. SCSIO 61187 TaxID=2722752 RepID=UPI00351D241C|nr:GNAT family N-acetyltransferase [Iamia sp. SCSIO 61187]
MLLHITTAAPWRVALAAGTHVTPSLPTEGFIHLSRPDQVALPANRLYAGRDDLLLLVIDPDRLDAEVRWEPGVPTDPGSMRFPHLYGPLPVAAVTSVVPWRPGPDGAFAEPVGLPAPSDGPGRARWFDRSLAERRAPIVVPVAVPPGAIGCRDPRVPSSYEHNAVWLTGAPSAAEVEAAGDLVLGDAGHRRVVLETAPAELDGWEVDEERILVLPSSVGVDGPAEVVTPVTSEVMAGLWRPSWRRDLPGASEAAIDDLVRREAFADAHLRIVDLAVLGGDGVPVAGTQLRIDGATAAIEAVLCDPDHRGRGFATALVADAVRRAREAGCDLVWLLAYADDWPRRWYERLGFVDVGARWVAHRRAAGDPRPPVVGRRTPSGRTA